MNDQEYIRKAVELTDDIWPWDFHKKESVLEFSGYDLDALAAQLVRQAYTHCVRPIELAGPIIYDLYDPMNTIKVIVDSKVLSNK